MFIIIERPVDQKTGNDNFLYKENKYTYHARLNNQAHTRNLHRLKGFIRGNIFLLMNQRIICIYSERRTYIRYFLRIH